MTKFERKLRKRTALVGIAVTLLVVALFAGGFLGGMERLAYDWRAEYFQHFTRPPTTQLVHIDIDDPSLEAIGRWPWPRARLGEIVDELRLAGCRAVAFDVIFSEPEEIQYVKPGDLEADLSAPAPGPATRSAATQPALVLTRPVDNDALFAQSLAQFGRAVVPVSLTLGSRQVLPPSFPQIRDLLVQNPGMDRKEVADALTASGMPPADVARAIAEGFAPAQREAMLDLVEKHAAGGRADFAQLRRIILPNTPVNVISSVPLNALRAACDRYNSLSALRKFSRSPQSRFPRLVSTTDEQATVAILARAAGATGYVDYIALHDGKVRMVPLWANHRGHAFPQVSLALACEYLGVDIQKVQISADRITIPCSDGRQIRIPVHSYTTSKGNTLGMFFDIPWFGRAGINQWQTMYDYPAHLQAKQHTPISFIWEARNLENKIERSNLRLLDGMSFFLVLFNGDGKGAAMIDALRRHDLRKADALLADLDALFKVDDWAFYKDVDPATAKDEVERQQFLKVREIPGQLRQLAAELRRLDQDLSARRAAIKSLLGGKAALVGWTAVGALADQVPTSLHPRCPGVVIHGAIFNAIVTGDFWHATSPWLNGALILLLGLLTTFLVANVRDWIAAIAVLALAVGYLLVNCYALFDYGNYLFDLSGPLLAIIAVWAFCTFARYIMAQMDRKEVRDQFANFVDNSLIDYVLESDKPILTGQHKELTIVFTDLAGFTSITEKVKEEAVEIIKEYMGRMIPIVKRKREAYLNKLLGDGIMFFYNAPKDDPSHAVDATVAVLEMQEAMIDFNDWLRARNLPAVAVRAGVFTGSATVGNIGVQLGALKYNDFTAIGDNVNLASRLEGANKSFGTKILLNQRTCDLIGEGFLLRPVGRIQVKGKNEWVMTYEPLAALPSATPEQRRLAELTAGVVNAFVEARFADCLAAIEAMEKEVGASRLTDLYREQAEEYLKSGPPAGFEGQIALHEK